MALQARCRSWADLAVGPRSAPGLRA